MNFLSFGGFVARLLGADNGSARPQEYAKQDSYVPIARQFQDMHRTVDRINNSLQRLEFHEKNLNNLEKLLSRIERMEREMQTAEFRKLAREVPGTQRKMFNMIEDLRYEARILLSHRYA